MPPAATSRVKSPAGSRSTSGSGGAARTWLRSTAACRAMAKVRRPAQIGVAAIIAGASSLAVSYRSIATYFEGGITWEFCQYAEIGRNLIQGKGFRTLRPSTLARARDANRN